jgi:hypothetical protein
MRYPGNRMEFEEIFRVKKEARQHTDEDKELKKKLYKSIHADIQIFETENLHKTGENSIPVDL